MHGLAIFPQKAPESLRSLNLNLAAQGHLLKQEGHGLVSRLRVWLENPSACRQMVVCLLVALPTHARPG